MKRLLVNFLIVMLVQSPSIQAQKGSACYAGVYLTKNDLVKNKLSHKINTTAEGNKFSFSFPADLKLTIKITTPDTTLHFKPGSVYGYSECGKKYRYYAGGDLLAQEDYYRIEESDGLVIYSSKFVSGDELFYSLDLNAPIRRLLLRNIEADFAAYPAFVETVKELNKEGIHGELGKRDEKGHFMINTLYARKVKAKKSGS